MAQSESLERGSRSGPYAGVPPAPGRIAIDRAPASRSQPACDRRFPATAFRLPRPKPQWLLRIKEYRRSDKAPPPTDGGIERNGSEAFLQYAAPQFYCKLDCPRRRCCKEW